MNNLCKQLMLGGSAAAMLAAISANAQAQEPAPPTENVTVSASRIQIQGYEAPTPVTVIGAETLQRDAKVDIGDAIRELPAVGISDSPGNGSHSGNASQGDAGIDTISLRGLGVVRTLVLFDGQRVVTSNPNSSGPPQINGVDLSTIPTSIIERVDVVTGGASAAWGSDAVAGVVNLVINKHFTGFKANAVFGNSSHNDHKSYKFEATAGTDFLGGRAHTEFAATYTMSPDIFYGWNRSWYNNNKSLYPCSLVNPANPSALCHTPTATYSTNFTNGGLITGSPAANGFISTGITGGTAAGNTAAQNLAGNLAYINALGQGFAGVGASPAAANILKNIQFVGPNAQPVPFNTGISSGGGCYACSANVDTDVANAPINAVPYHNYTLFSYTSFKVTDDITASVMLNYGWNAEQNQANDGRRSQQAIGIDNPFLPASIRQAMISGGIPQITLGTSAIENLTNHRDVSLFNLSKSIAQNYIQNYRQLVRGVFTLTGGYRIFGEDWSWNAYAQQSQVRERQWARYNTYNQNFSNAVDSVTVTATGKDSLGAGDPVKAAQVAAALNAAGAHVPQVGEAACRSALTATSWGVTQNSAGQNVIQPGGLMAGCVPLNLFGDGTVSQAALNYIAPGRLNPSIADQALYRMNQSVFSISTQGTLPWGLDAGKIAMAFGFEDRLEQQRNQRDPLQFGATGVFESGNFSEFAGQYNVQEGFLEVTVPVLKNQFVESLELNAAGRITSYSNSGLVQTWKLGATSQINDDIRMRATFSNDIRAPGIGELYSSVLISTQQIAYPQGGPVFNVHQGSGGYSGLVPEQAQTVSGGIVLTPHWIENLSLSFDWYSITLHKGIFQYNANQIFDQCANKHVAVFCSVVFFGKGWPGNGNTPVQAEVDGNGVNVGSSVGLYSADSEGAFNYYIIGPLNATSETTSGLDFQVDYMHDLLAGTMNWHLVGNYTDEKTRTSLGVTTDGAGALSGDAANPLSGFTTPKFRATLTSTYTEGDWSLTGQARMIGSARLVNTWVEGVNVDNNGIPWVVYADLRGSYRWNDHIQLYGAVDNAFDTPPPNIPSTGGGGYNCAIYDCIGRSYRIGVRFDD